MTITIDDMNIYKMVFVWKNTLDKTGCFIVKVTIGVLNTSGMTTNSCIDDDYDILGALIRIMEEDDNGPALKMRKRRNGADQFYMDYHEEYESRFNESRDKVSRVKNHNTAYPKLHDELSKKKSITKVTTIDARKFSADFDPRCSACARLMTLTELQRKNVKFKCYNKKNSSNSSLRRHETWLRNSRSRDRWSRDPKYRVRDRRSRISKRKSNSTQRNITKNLKDHTDSRLKNTRSCQYSSYILVQDKKMGTSQGYLNDIRKTVARQSDLYVEATSKNLQFRTSDHSEKLSHPGSKATTLSSYNSFPSIDHEPMVTS